MRNRKSLAGWGREIRRLCFFLASERNRVVWNAPTSSTNIHCCWWWRKKYTTPEPIDGYMPFKASFESTFIRTSLRSGVSRLQVSNAFTWCVAVGRQRNLHGQETAGGERPFSYPASLHHQMIWLRKKSDLLLPWWMPLITGKGRTIVSVKSPKFLVGCI